MINTVLLLLCSLAGLAVVIYTFIPLITAMKKYEKVKAVCIRVDSRISHDSDGDCTLYQPIWEYYYNSQKFTSAMGSSASFLNIQIGTEKIIYVDPDNPLKIYTVFLKSILFQTVIGMMFFLFFLAAVINKFKN